jgi:hypothetical protein
MLKLEFISPYEFYRAYELRSLDTHLRGIVWTTGDEVVRGPGLNEVCVRMMVICWYKDLLGIDSMRDSVLMSHSEPWMFEPIEQGDLALYTDMAFTKYGRMVLRRTRC